MNQPTEIWRFTRNDLERLPDSCWTDDSSYLRGCGLFETMLAVGDQLPGFPQHWQRLVASCRHFSLPLPDLTEVQSGWRSLSQQLPSAAYCSARLTVSGTGRTQPWFGAPSQTNWSWTVSRSKAPFPIPRSWRLTYSPYVFHSDRPTAGHKTTSFLDWIVARREAQQRDFDDAILLNQHGDVSECTAANVFVVVQNQILTPDLSSGCLPGTMRQRFIQQLTNIGLPVSTTRLTRAIMDRAEFAFATSATTGAIPITSIDQQTLPLPQPAWWEDLLAQLKVQLQLPD